MIYLLISFFTSLISTLFVIRYQHLHSHFSLDYDFNGVQKFHVAPVPRVGGLGVIFGLLIALLFLKFIEPNQNPVGLILLFCSLFAFFAGFIEDITKKIGVKERLTATIISAIFGGWLLGGWVTRLDVWGFDELLAVPAISILVTCVAIAGVANAYNIIDGYNGLVGVVAIIVLLGLAYVSEQVGDYEISKISIITIGSIAGFLVWNFPRGLIFLGDSGAYLIGFIIAELSVMLVARNPTVSPWFPLLLSLYPIFETIFSIYRKKIKRGMSPGLPDGLHFHMLIYKRVVRWAVRDNSKKQKTTRNALTSPYLWALTSFTVVPAILFWNSTNYLMFFSLLFIFSYLYLYRLLVKGRFPTLLKINRK